MTAVRSAAPLDHEALLEILNGTAAETGEAFLDNLVRHRPASARATLSPGARHCVRGPVLAVIE